MIALGELASHVGEEFLDGASRRRLAGVGAFVAPAFRIAVRGLEEKLFLVPERGIEAGRIDAHRFREVADGGALETLAPEDLDGCGERGLAVEGTRPPTGLAGLGGGCGG